MNVSQKCGRILPATTEESQASDKLSQAKTELSQVTTTKSQDMAMLSGAKIDWSQATGYTGIALLHVIYTEISI